MKDEYRRTSLLKAKATSDLHQALVTANPDGIIIVDHSGVVRFANPAAAALLGDKYEQLLGRKLDLPLPIQRVEMTVADADGPATIVELRLVETEWEGEVAYQASLRDITGHMQARRELGKKAAELENRNIELDEFAHTVAHQVQGLMSQIVGYASYADLHHTANADPELAFIIRQILESGHKMSNVINELLLLSSVRRDHVDIMPLDMGRVVSEAQKRLRIQIEKYEAIVLQPESWPVALGHGSWTEEVWVNYISNGLKYGGRPPQLELGATVLSGEMIRFWVKDNGQGIAPTDQKKLFKPHTRLRQIQVRGEGLGLSIVRRIVERCGGQVGVESELGRGSLFWFTLPAAPAGFTP